MVQSSNSVQPRSYCTSPWTTTTILFPILSHDQLSFLPIFGAKVEGRGKLFLCQSSIHWRHSTTLSFYSVRMSEMERLIITKFKLSASTICNAPLPELRHRSFPKHFHDQLALLPISSAKVMGHGKLHLTTLGNGASPGARHSSLYGTQDDSYNQDGSHHQSQRTLQKLVFFESFTVKERP